MAGPVHTAVYKVRVRVRVRVRDTVTVRVRVRVHTSYLSLIRIPTLTLQGPLRADRCFRHRHQPVRLAGLVTRALALALALYLTLTLTPT